MTKSKRKPGKPITAHRLFPAFTGLWFAALFGLVSFAVPVVLLQDGVGVLGLPKLLPAAAPPLGFTARALVALAMTGLGGILGLLVGLRLGRRRRTGVSVAPQAFGRRPARAVEEALVEPAPALGEALRVRARDAHPDAPPRRPLTVSDDMLDEAETRILADEAAPTGPFGLRRLSGEDARDAAFDPFAIYESDLSGGEAFAPPAFLAQALDEAAARIEASEKPLVEAVAPEPLPAAPVESEPVESGPAESGPAESELADLAPVETEIEEREPVALIGPAAEEEVASLFARARRAVGEAGGSPVASADLDGLGLVQLVERLALAIAGHRAALDAAMIDDDARDAELPTLASGVLSAGRDAGRDSAVVPMARLYRAAPHGPETAGAASDGETAVLEERYSSLVDALPAARRGEAARSDGLALAVPDHAASPQSLVIFPGQARAMAVDAGAAMVAPAAPFERPYLAAVPSRFQAVASGEGSRPSDPDSAEQALRDALATLQRMTANR